MTQFDQAPTKGLRPHRGWKLKAAVAATAIVIAISVNAYLLDGLVGWFWAAIGAAPTEFGTGYSDQSFRRIEKGMSVEEVTSIVGTPLTVFFRYSDGKYLEFDGLSGRSVSAHGLTFTDISTQDAKIRIGEPLSEVWNYSRSPTTSDYRLRAVVIERGRVTERIHSIRWE